MALTRNPLRAVRFTIGGTVEHCDLGGPQDAGLTRERDRAPCVLVLATDDLSRLPWTPGLLIDRGRKHAAKALAPLLLGHDRIPVIRGSYRSAGQLLRSVRALLDRALHTGDRNVYMLGVDPALFRRLWDGATTDGVAPSEAPARRAQPSHGLLDLLPRLPVPDAVRERFVGESPEVDLVRQLVLRAAQHDHPVLILGDTGTGKEVVARLIHDQSPRRLQTFTPVNCGAIPRELFEAELFGYEKGAHSTAAGRKLGLWRVAHGGTLFLDEIGDLSLEHQVKVLRALEQGEIRPVGAEREQRVDARVVAATNRDILGMVQSGALREDLYYRLRSFMIHTPALRDHPDDIPALARYFWQSVTGGPQSELPSSILRELAQYRWPGNARELRMVLSSLFALFGSDGLGVEHLKAVFAFEGQTRATVPDGSRDHGFRIHAGESLRHLRRTAEVIRACQVTLRPLTERLPDQRRVRTQLLHGLRSRAAELEVLCLRPVLFHSEVTFGSVQSLTASVTSLASLMAEAQAAWPPEVQNLERHLDLTLSLVFREVDRLLALHA
jgi:DNA-binding NtrC family response regulator